MSSWHSPGNSPWLYRKHVAESMQHEFKKGWSYASPVNGVNEARKDRTAYGAAQF